MEYWHNGHCLRVLQALNLIVTEGQFVTILGPSGCGKTTLLRIIAGLVRPTVGDVIVGGLPAIKARAQRATSFVFQSPVLFAWRTVLENILLPFEIHIDNYSTQTGQDERFKKAYEMIELVGLKGFEKAYPHQLSGGMQSRVAIARALIYAPKIILMDEPFGSLDELTRTRMNMELLNLWSETKSTILFVTHSINEAILLSDRVLVMEPRPSWIFDDVAIELARPRKIDMLETEEFGMYSRALRRSLGMV